MAESYKVAGIDVHKSMLAVVIADVAGEGEFEFERRKFATLDSDLKELAEWFQEQGVREAVMESTAQYWKPVWRELEPHCRLHLAQAHSNRAPRGRKRDFQDAERLVRRHVAGELILSFVPDPEQRLWRIVTRTKHQLVRDRVRLYGQLESLLEDGRIKLATCLSDLLGMSGRRILSALAGGETDPTVLGGLVEPEVQASRSRLTDALQAARHLSPLHRQILRLFLDRASLLEQQMADLHQSIATALRGHQEAVLRLAEVPGFGIDSAQQVIAEVGPQAATFPTPGQLASWVGVCPGREESAEVSHSNASPKGNRMMRHVLTQAAHAAARTRGSRFQLLYRRWVPRLGHNKALWAIAHRLCRLVWKILHEGVAYIEHGSVPDPKALQRRLRRLTNELRSLGYQVIPPETRSEAVV
jgi:transposase